ncbi:MAG: hypothetical protein WD530_02830 [Vicingaceae bacterium]
MKKVIIASALVVVGLAACQSDGEKKETTTEKEAAQAKLVEMEEEAAKLEEAKAEIDETSAELDSLIENL